MGKARTSPVTESQEEITRMLSVKPELEFIDKTYVTVPDHFEILQIPKIDKDRKSINPTHVNITHKNEQIRKISKLVYSDR